VDRDGVGKSWGCSPGPHRPLRSFRTTSRGGSRPAHELIAVVSPGYWTSYGDIAKVVGLPALGIGHHVASCEDCPDGAHRVMMQGGVRSEGFHWADPEDDRDLLEVLQGEGLTFDAAGKADPSKHLSSSQLPTMRMQKAGQ